MKIELTRNANVSLIDQIYFEISERIESKLLRQGMMLPSVRKLAQELNVSIVTVHKAYTRLVKEGYIEIFRGKGAYVRGDRHERSDPKQRKTASPLDWQLNISDYIHRAQMVQYLQVSKPIQFATSVIYPKLLPTR